jgi:hypothetical protein
MARSPYQAARTMRDVTGAKAQTGQILRGLVEQQGKKKKEMTDEFQKQVAAAERNMQAELRKKMSKSKRRRGLFSKILSGLVGFIPGAGPILAGLIGAASARKGIKDQQSHARGQIAKAQQYGLDPRFANTFLSSGVQDFKSKKESMLDELYAKTDVSSGDLLKATALGGLTGWGLGKMTSGFGKGFKGASAEVAPDVSQMNPFTEAGKSAISEGPIIKDPTFLDKLKGGWEGAKGGFDDFTGLMGADGKLSPENLTMLLMLLGDSADDI